MPANPNTAAIIEMMKKTAAQYNIFFHPLWAASYLFILYHHYGMDFNMILKITFIETVM